MRVALLTPPSPYDGATYPYEWGGKQRGLNRAPQPRIEHVADAVA